MILYLLVSLLIAVIGIMAKGKKKRIPFYIALLILVLFAGLRGDFTTDYKSYCSLFEQANSFSSLSALIDTPFYIEKGFMVLMYLFGRVWNSPLAFMFSMSAVTVVLIVKEIGRWSDMPWLSILLFVGIGTYYESFNISRYILVTAILFAGTRYIFERKFVKYLILVFIASMLHRIAILMIPMYFVLPMKITKKNIFRNLMISIMIIGSVPLVVTIIQRVFPVYQNYVFGMDGGSWKAVVAPAAMLFLVAFYLIVNKGSVNFDIDKIENRVMINSLVFYVVIMVCSLQVYMVTRVAFLLAPYAWILTSNLIRSIKYSRDRFVWTCLVGIMAIIYPLFVLSNTGFDPYYFTTLSF